MEETKAYEVYEKNSNTITGGIEYRKEVSPFSGNDTYRFYSFKVGRKVWTVVISDEKGMVNLFPGKAK